MGVVLHFQSTGTVPGDARPVSMVGGALTIGRGPENDLALPDPAKVISKRHCAIEDHGGNVVVVDLSTNGTFLNYAKTPLGRAPTPLNDGDILTLGPYELMVEIVAERRSEPAIPPPADAPARAAPRGDLDDLLGGDAGGDFVDELLGDAPPRGPSGVTRPELGEDGLLPPLGEEEDPLARDDPFAGQGASQDWHGDAAIDQIRSTGAIPDDWDDDLPGGGGAIPEDDFLPPPQGAADPVAPPPAPPPPDLPADPPVPPGRAAPAAGDPAARAFLRALGAEALEVPDAELAGTMERLGRVMRSVVAGLREVLMTRAQVKSEFRIEQTRIGSGANNPLKFSISAEQAVEAMVRPRTSGYLAADAAAEEALRDVKAHEVAMMAGMEAAVKGILTRLSPTELAGRIETGGGLGSVLKGRKARYWEVYEKMYAEIADQAENEFHELFAREFARAYRAQMEKLK